MWYKIFDHLVRLNRTAPQNLSFFIFYDFLHMMTVEFFQVQKNFATLTCFHLTGTNFGHSKAIFAAVSFLSLHILHFPSMLSFSMTFLTFPCSQCLFLCCHYQSFLILSLLRQLLIGHSQHLAALILFVASKTLQCTLT